MRLKEDYRLMKVTDEYYKDVTPEGEMKMPTLLSLSEFNIGQVGLALYSKSKQCFVFGPEKFYDIFKKK